MPSLSYYVLLEIFQFFQEAGEADVWMNDRAGLAASQDFGRDEDAAVKLLKKHKVRMKGRETCKVIIIAFF